VNCSGFDHQATDKDVGSYDSREGGGRVAPGAATEGNAGAVTEMVEMHGIVRNNSSEHVYEFTIKDLTLHSSCFTVQMLGFFYDSLQTACNGLCYASSIKSETTR